MESYKIPKIQYNEVGKSHTKFIIADVSLWEKAGLEEKVHLNSFSSFIKLKTIKFINSHTCYFHILLWYISILLILKIKEKGNKDR